MEILIGQEIYAMVGFGVDWEQFRMGQRDLEGNQQRDSAREWEEEEWLAGEAGENPGETEEEDEDDEDDEDDEEDEDEDEEDEDEDDEAEVED